MNPNTSYLTVLHDAKEWSTEIEGEIGEIRVDGQKISDVHDLTLQIAKLQKTNNILCLISCCAFIALLVSFLVMVPDPVLVEQHMEKIDTIYKKTMDGPANWKHAKTMEKVDEIHKKTVLLGNN